MSELNNNITLLQLVNSYNDLFYKPGDVINLYSFEMAGYTTDGNSSICGSIPVYKRLDNINSFTINNFKVNIRDCDGYITGNGVYTEGGEEIITNNISSTDFIISRESNRLTFTLTYKSSWTRANSNACISIYCTYAKITLS